jgi:hypothetical protein
LLPGGRWTLKGWAKLWSIMLASGLVKKIPDLYRLRYEDLIRLERMGQKALVISSIRLRNQKSRECGGWFRPGYQARWGKDGPDPGSTL